ncbi:unnamed protein product, partial [Urochloa humidicola]
QKPPPRRGRREPRSRRKESTSTTARVRPRARTATAFNMANSQEKLVPFSCPKCRTEGNFPERWKATHDKIHKDEAVQAQKEEDKKKAEREEKKES